MHEHRMRNAVAAEIGPDAFIEVGVPKGKIDVLTKDLIIELKRGDIASCRKGISQLRKYQPTLTPRRRQLLIFETEDHWLTTRQESDIVSQCNNEGIEFVCYEVRQAQGFVAKMGVPEKARPKLLVGGKFFETPYAVEKFVREGLKSNWAERSTRIRPEVKEIILDVVNMSPFFPRGTPKVVNAKVKPDEVYFLNETNELFSLPIINLIHSLGRQPFYASKKFAA